MLPLERAQLFYADEHELRIGMFWQQFMTKMASAWSSALKKRRMMIDIGLDVSENKPLPAEIRDRHVSQPTSSLLSPLAHSILM